jgi:hypothetical protein
VAVKARYYTLSEEIGGEGAEGEGQGKKWSGQGICGKKLGIVIAFDCLN